MAKMGLPLSINARIILCSRVIRSTCKEYRGKDAPTDVLSFPALEYNEEYKLAQPITQDCYDPEYNAVFLGDMVICDDKIREQAEEYGHSYERELSYLTVHSMYHLLGYDHETEELKRDMREKEEKILKL